MTRLQAYSSVIAVWVTAAAWVFALRAFAEAKCWIGFGVVAAVPLVIMSILAAESLKD